MTQVKQHPIDVNPFHQTHNSLLEGFITFVIVAINLILLLHRMGYVPPTTNVTVVVINLIRLRVLHSLPPDLAAANLDINN